MSATSPARALGLQSLAVAAAAGLPTLLRPLLPTLVTGPIRAAHVMLAQAAFLVIAVAGARRVARMVDRPLPPWYRWAIDAAGLAGAVALILAARASSDPSASMALGLDTLTLVIAAPIVEEILYRGLLPALLAPHGGVVPTLRQRLGIATVASAAFAAAHLGGPWHAGSGAARAFALSFGCGLALHLLRDTSGGLGAPMVAHAGLNAMTLPARGW